MMLWRRWGLGMLLPLSSSGYSPVSSRNMLSKCHEVALSNSVTSSSPLCSFLPLPSQGGSQWPLRAWKLLATCSAHTLSTQQFLSLPLVAFSLHLTAPPPSQCAWQVSPTWATADTFNLISCLPCLTFGGPGATMQLNMASETADQITPVSALIPLLSHVKFVVKSIILTPTK